MSNKLTYTVNYLAVDYTPRPINGWEKTSEKDETNIEQGFFIDKIGKLKFGRDDYSLFETIESDAACNVATIVITKTCSGSEQTIFSGKFTRKDISLNASKCTAEVDIKNNDVYSCIFSNWKADTNILNQGNAQSRSIFLNNIQTVVTTTQAVQGQDYGGATDFVDSITILGTVYYIYARAVHIVDCDGTAPPTADVPADYTLLSSDCLTFGTATFTQPVFQLNGIFTASQTPGDNSFQVNDTPTIYLSSAFYGNQLFASLDNGRTFEDVLLKVAQEACATITTVVSDFFQINPLTASTTNYVTGQENPYTDLVVYQTSDVAFWDASENATRGMMNFEQLMKDLHVLFFVKWWVDGTSLRLEHYSYAQSTGSVDLTGVSGRLFEREKAKLFGRHTYETPFQRNFAFVGLDVTYTSECVEDTVQKNATKYFIADIAMVIAHPDDTPLESFVLAHTDGTIINLYDTPNTVVPVLNGALAWTNLIPDFHGYEKSDTNSSITVSTTVKSKKKTANVDDCCDTFDVFQQVTTEFGTGEVQSVKWKPKTGRKEVKILV